MESRYIYRILVDKLRFARYNSCWNILFGYEPYSEINGIEYLKETEKNFENYKMWFWK